MVKNQSIPATVACFVCDCRIETDKHGDGSLYDAVYFTTHGNYGSREFDSMHGALRIYVCDSCVADRAGRGFYVSTISRTEFARFEPFNREDESQS